MVHAAQNIEKEKGVVESGWQERKAMAVELSILIVNKDMSFPRVLHDCITHEICV